MLAHVSEFSLAVPADQHFRSIRGVGGQWRPCPSRGQAARPPWLPCGGLGSRVVEPRIKIADSGPNVPHALRRLSRVVRRVVPGSRSSWARRSGPSSCLVRRTCTGSSRPPSGSHDLLTSQFARAGNVTRITASGFGGRLASRLIADLLHRGVKPRLSAPSHPRPRRAQQTPRQRPSGSRWPAGGQFKPGHRLPR